MTNDVQGQLDRVREFAGDTATVAADRIKATTARAREQLESGREVYTRSVEKAGATYADARDRTVKAAARANDFVQEHPLAAAAAAATAGAVLAALIPGARNLAKAAPAALAAIGAKVAEAAETASETIGSGAETVRASAVDTAGRVASEARAKLDVADLRGRASDLSEAAITLAKDAAETVNNVIGKFRK